MPFTVTHSRLSLYTISRVGLLYSFCEASAKGAAIRLTIKAFILSNLLSMPNYIFYRIAYSCSKKLNT